MSLLCARRKEIVFATVVAAVWSNFAATIEVKPGDGTIAAAVEKLRVLRAGQPDEPVTVRLAGGVYELAGTIRLTAKDATAPVLFTAADGAEVLVSGGRCLKGGRVDGGVVKFPVPEWKDGSWKIEQLYINGRRALRPSVPENQYFYPEGRIDDPEDAEKAKADAAKGNPRKVKAAYDRFIAAPGQIPEEWKGVEVIVPHGWVITRARIKSYNPATRETVIDGGRPGYMHDITTDRHYRLENVKAAFGKPGEWYADTGSGEIFYTPLKTEKAGSLEVVAPRLHTLFVVEGDPASNRKAGNITFEKITFAHTAFVLPDGGCADHQASLDHAGAIVARFADNVVVQDCDIRRTGGWGVKFEGGCTGCAVRDSRLFDLGAGGVEIGSPKRGIRKNNRAEYTERCAVERCFIECGGRVHPAAIGVAVTLAGHNLVSHNTIRDFYYSAVSVGHDWGDGNPAAAGNIVEWNHIYDIGQRVLSDLAAVYTLGEQPGTEIRNNLIHDVWTARYGAQGVYLDQGSKYITVSNNVIVRALEASFSSAAGACGHNLFANNIFMFPRRYAAWLYSEKDYGNWMPKHRHSPGHQLFIERNIFLGDENLKGMFPAEGRQPLSDRIHFKGNTWWNIGWPEDFKFSSWTKGTNVLDVVTEDDPPEVFYQSPKQWRDRLRLKVPSEDVANFLAKTDGDVVADPLLAMPYGSEAFLFPAPDSPAVKNGFVPFDLSREVGAGKPHAKGKPRMTRPENATQTFPRAPLSPSAQRTLAKAESAAKDTLRLIVFKQRFTGGGAGFALLFRTPNGKNYLFDAGNGGNCVVPFSCGRDEIDHYLYEHDIRKLDGVIVSHSHGDHFGGLIWLADKYKADKFWDSGYTFPGSTGAGEDGWVKILREKMLRFHPDMACIKVRRGDKMDWDADLDVTVINPPPGAGIPVLDNDKRPKNDTPGHHLLNANAIGIRVKFKDVVFQVNGDIQEDYAHEHLFPFIREAYAENDRKVDVLVALSHGIHATREEAELSRPKIALGSIYFDGAPKNWCRQWARERGVLNREFEAVGAKCFDSGVWGTVAVTSDGKTCYAETEFKKPRKGVSEYKQHGK